MDLSHLDRVFAATDGVFTVPMALALGYTERSVRHWIERGDIERVCGRAFVRRGHPITVRERAIGARLTWPDAIVCFTTAARLQDLPLDDDGVTHVLVPSMRRPVQGIHPHFWSVRPTEVIRRGVLVMTDRRTTLADCLGRMPDEGAWGALAWMFTRKKITADDVAAQIAERHHLYGVVRLRAMAAALRRSAVSLPEVQLQELLEEYRITGWRGNYEVRAHGRVVALGDVGFAAGRLLLEYDGAIAHGPKAKARDARRDRRVEELGYIVLHVAWGPLHSWRRLLAQTIRALLASNDPVRRRHLAAAWNEGRFLDLAAELASTATDGAIG